MVRVSRLLLSPHNADISLAPGSASWRFGISKSWFLGQPFDHVTRALGIRPTCLATQRVNLTPPADSVQKTRFDGHSLQAW